MNNALKDIKPVAWMRPGHLGHPQFHLRPNTNQRDWRQVFDQAALDAAHAAGRLEGFAECREAIKGDWAIEQPAGLHWTSGAAEDCYNAIAALQPAEQKEAKHG